MRWLALVSAVALATPGSGRAEETELLRTAPLGAARAAAEPGRHAIGVDAAALLSLAPGDTASLVLPGAPRRAVRLERVERHPSGARTWFGALAADPAGRPGAIALTLGAGGVWGAVQAPEGEYRIESDARGARLVDVAAAGLAPAPPGDAPAPPAGAGDAGAAAVPVAALPAPPARKSVLDLLVLYTPGLRARLGSALESRLDHVVAIGNRALADSGVRARLRLVGAVEVAYPDRTSNAAALGHLTDGSHAALAGAAALRDLYGADLVSLVRPFDNATHGGCGTGWIGGYGGVPIAFANAFAYSVVSDGESQGLFCDDVSFVHEISHNLGCMHDRPTAAAQGGGQGAFAFGFGYGVPGVFGTVMSYVFPRLARFSNPDQLCLGLPCGVDEQLPASANNALAIELARGDVERFRAATQLDFEFGDAGRAVLAVASARAGARAVALAADGGIVVAGAVERAGNRSSFAVARLRRDGSPDPDFGAGGVAEHEIAGARGAAEAVAVQVDGKIVVAGALVEGSATSLAVLRLEADGDLDPSFGDAGVLVVRRAHRRLAPAALSVDVAGRILIGGTAEGTGPDAGTWFAFLARARSRGSLDRRFGEKGIVEREMPGGDGRIAAMAVVPNGDVVLAGAAPRPEAGAARFLGMRFDARGEPAAGWASQGVALGDLGPGSGGATAIAVAADGAVVAAGSWRAGPSARERVAMLRWSRTGRLDADFGSGGALELDLGDQDARAAGLGVTADDRIVVAGSVGDGADAAFVVARLRPQGKLDRAFASRGVAATRFPGRAAAARAIALQPSDGRIVVAGEAATAATSAFAVARHDRRPFQR